MRMRTIAYLSGLLTLLALMFLSVPAAAAQQQGTPRLVLRPDGAAAQQDVGDPDRGAQLFAENCATCHGAKGEGRVGASLRDIFVSINPEGDLRAVITKGRAGTLMPTWGEAYGGPLSEQDVNDIIAFIETWGTTYQPPATLPPAIVEDLPPVPEVDGDPNKGYTVFQENCATCHGTKGEGRIGATLNTTFTALNAGGFIIDTIKTGVPGTMMPPWAKENGGPLTDDQINDVAAYVLSIQKAAVARPAEVTSKGSALPLVLIGALSIVVILALGLATQNRQKSE